MYFVQMSKAHIHEHTHKIKKKVHAQHFIELRNSLGWWDRYESQSQHDIIGIMSISHRLNRIFNLHQVINFFPNSIDIKHVYNLSHSLKHCVQTNWNVGLLPAERRECELFSSFTGNEPTKHTHTKKEMPDRKESHVKLRSKKMSNIIWLCNCSLLLHTTLICCTIFIHKSYRITQNWCESKMVHDVIRIAMNNQRKSVVDIGTGLDEPSINFH